MKAGSTNSTALQHNFTVRSESGYAAFQSGWLARDKIGHSSWKQRNDFLHSRRPPSNTEFPNSIARRAHTLCISASGNGQEPMNTGDGKDGLESSSMQMDPAIAKEKLFRIITELINDDAQILEVEKLIHRLESVGITPITEDFAEMGLAGSWKLLFSSTRTRPQGSVRIRKIGQTINTKEKKLFNKAIWSFNAKDGIHSIKANLSVNCTYKFVGPGRFEITVDEHKVQILGAEDGKKYELPDDLETLIGELRLALPIDFFDPSGLVDVSYMEPNFRIARFLGKRIAGVRNIFIRDSAD